MTPSKHRKVIRITAEQALALRKVGGRLSRPGKTEQLKIPESQYNEVLAQEVHTLENQDTSAEVLMGEANRNMKDLSLSGEWSSLGHNYLDSKR